MNHYSSTTASSHLFSAGRRSKQSSRSLYMISIRKWHVLHIGNTHSKSWLSRFTSRMASLFPKENIDSAGAAALKCMCVCMYVCMYIYIYILVWYGMVWYGMVRMYVCMYACMDGWMDVGTYVRTYVCMYVCMYISKYIYIYIMVIYIHKSIMCVWVEHLYRWKTSIRSLNVSDMN